MSPHNQTIRQEILDLQPDLMQTAGRLTGDDNEAHNLVHMTMIEAFSLSEARENGDDTRVWMFGLLRGAFHSVARRRAVRQERGFRSVQRQLEREAEPAAQA
jgi:DNA-directed RNA polymerase specialized sigma24 family protein